jgi:four helix bundle protein
LDFPEYETYSLSDQIRRSARSIGAHIAEAWAHREYENSFKSKLTNSTGELNETLHWLQIALEADYLDPGECESLVNEYQKLRRMLNSMINRSDEFCSTN